jgi:hypothetical protein
VNPTGPRTPEGKLRSRYNALKHGLTGQTLCIHDDERDQYQAHVQSYIDLYQPVGHAEQVLVRNIADDYWRSMRGRALEHRHMNQALTGNLEDLKVLSNLALYLNRIERSIRNNTQALETMQRQRREAGRTDSAHKNSEHQETAAKEFVFSNPQTADTAQAFACGSDVAQALACEARH